MAKKASEFGIAGRTLPMSVANMTFMVDRLGEDCSPLQYVRELTENSIAAIEALPDQSGEIIWDVDWNNLTLTDHYKLAVIDTGIGMTGEEMVRYINKLSSSIHQQSKSGNFGVGAKIAAAPRNHAGLVYLSWKAGTGYMIHLWCDPDEGVYGLRQFEHPDGSFQHWAYVSDDVKPDAIKEHGTMVILLGNEHDQNTMFPPEGTPMPSRWVLRYLNSRYFRFPEGVTVKAREGWELPRSDSRHNFLRKVTGQGPWLDDNSSSRGTIELSGASAHWWIIKPKVDQDSGHLLPSGHVAALYQDELYEVMTGRAGVTRLQAFGIIFGHSRVVIYIEPDNLNDRLTSNTSRTHLLLNGEALPWSEWAAEFRSKLPNAIEHLMEQVVASATSHDHKQSIRERLHQIRELFRISRYRPTPDGEFLMDEARLMRGGDARRSEGSERDGSAPTGEKGGRAGDIYGLFLAAKGVPGEEFRPNPEPDVKWITLKEGTRTPPDLEDRAAKFLPQQNLLLINGDFRVYTDMVDRWTKRYEHVPAARPVVEQVVQEWFEQQLVETVLGVQCLTGSKHWTVEDLERVWSQESLTAAVMPRYHVDVAVKRALGAKLGSLKDMAA